MLRAKPKAGAKWLPSQVYDGMDTSDPDPANWRPFGTRLEIEQEKEKHSKKPSTNDS